MTDLYGNPEQHETVTTALLQSRKDKRQESDNAIYMGFKVFRDLTREATAVMLEAYAKSVRESKADRFRMEMNIDEVKKQ